LEWLREQYPLDEQAAAERWVEQEASKLEEQLGRRGQSLGLYKSDDEESVQVSGERRQDEGQGREQALQGTGYVREGYGESGLEAIRRDFEEQRRAEEQERAEEYERELGETGDETLQLMRQAYAKYSRSGISPFEAGYMEAIMARHSQFAEKESPSEFERTQYAKLRENFDKVLASAGHPTMEMTLSEEQTPSRKAIASVKEARDRGITGIYGFRTWQATNSGQSKESQDWATKVTSELSEVPVMSNVSPNRTTLCPTPTYTTSEQHAYQHNSSAVLSLPSPSASSSSPPS